MKSLVFVGNTLRNPQFSLRIPQIERQSLALTCYSLSKWALVKKYRISLVESEEGFAVWCDDLPGCCSQGKTRREAVENIRYAIREYLAAQAEVEESGAKITRELVTA